MSKKLLIPLSLLLASTNVNADIPTLYMENATITGSGDTVQQFSLWPQATLFPALGVEQSGFSGYETSPPA